MILTDYFKSEHVALKITPPAVKKLYHYEKGGSKSPPQRVLLAYTTVQIIYCTDFFIVKVFNKIQIRQARLRRKKKQKFEN